MNRTKCGMLGEKNIFDLVVVNKVELKIEIPPSSNSIRKVKIAKIFI